MKLNANASPTCALALSMGHKDSKHEIKHAVIRPPIHLPLSRCTEYRGQALSTSLASLRLPKRERERACGKCVHSRFFIAKRREICTVLDDLCDQSKVPCYLFGREVRQHVEQLWIENLFVCLFDCERVKRLST